MTNVTNVFFVLTEPIFSKNDCHVYPHFSKPDSSFLYVTLLKNLYEIFSSVLGKEDLFLCLNEKDKEMITLTSPPFLSANTFYFDEQTFTNDFTSIFEKRKPGARNFIFLRPDFVGLTNQDISQILDLLTLDDDVLVIKKSLHKKIALFATNNYQPEIPELIHKKNFVCESALKKLCGLDYQLYKLKNVFSLEQANDFKELYQMLSRKENYACCSKQMHDRFTHLFIEYKELL
ncbi:MAG: hypothetical protein Q8N83_17435 [Ignavibacteria bacterium]|nr:hypothetical protein [Ignavibacteria bacterium]